MEEILVCLSGAPSNVRVIKAAAKMAEAYGGNLTALYVQPPYFHEHDPGAKYRREENFRLAHRLGAKVTRLYGEDAATQIAEYARVSGSTKIVIGKSPTHPSVFRKKTLVDRLNELAPDIDIFIIPGNCYHYTLSKLFQSKPSSSQVFHSEHIRHLNVPAQMAYILL